MPNSRYVKGRKKEYKFVNRAKAEGLLSFRSAGSHSPIDVVIIDVVQKDIRFIQCKPDNLSETQKNKIKEELRGLNGSFMVQFEVV